MNNSSIFDQIEISQKNDPIIISEKIPISKVKKFLSLFIPNSDWSTRFSRHHEYMFIPIIWATNVNYTLWGAFIFDTRCRCSIESLCTCIIITSTSKYSPTTMAAIGSWTTTRWPLLNFINGKYSKKDNPRHYKNHYYSHNELEQVGGLSGHFGSVNIVNTTCIVCPHIRLNIKIS